MKRSLFLFSLFLFLLLLLPVAPSYADLLSDTAAQSTNAAVVNPPAPAPVPRNVTDVVYGGAVSAGKFIWANGELCGGAGGTFDRLGHGNLSAVSAAMINLLATNSFVHVGPAASVCVADTTHVGLGGAASIPLHHFKGLETTQLGPMAHFADWRVGAGVTADIDAACRGAFAGRTTTAWLFASKPF